MYLRTAINSQLPLARRHKAHTGLWQFSQGLNLVDEVEHSRNRARYTATEMNFGLHSADSARLT